MIHFEELGKIERLLLLKALDINYKDLVCEECGEKTDYETCGIMPPTSNAEGKTTILCKSVLCLASYLEDIE
jgi:hypothetical protein